jgi:hypothetical protein
MGLLDVFNGMQNGPRGNVGGGGGMSPITMALLGLLAYKAVKGFGGSAAPAGSAPAPSGGGFGGLGDLFRGGGAASGMGGALGAGGIGGLLTGGLGDLLKQFQGAGKGDVADSWVGHRAEPADCSHGPQQGPDARTDRVPDGAHGIVARGAVGRPQRPAAQGDRPSHA